MTSINNMMIIMLKSKLISPHLDVFYHISLLIFRRIIIFVSWIGLCFYSILLHFFDGAFYQANFNSNLYDYSLTVDIIIDYF